MGDKVRRKKPGNVCLASILDVVEFLNENLSLVNSKSIQKSYFTWVHDLESNYYGILKEVEAFLSENGDNLPSFKDLQSKQKLITNDDEWQIVFLYVFKEKIEKNCENFPLLSVLLTKIPNLNNAMLSVLKPGKYLPLHRGPYNGLLRYHLPIMVPKDSNDCCLSIDGFVHLFREGESIIFDDTCQHEAWNYSDVDRVNLVIDFKRPLPWFMRFVNHVIISCLKYEKDTQELLSNLK